MKNERTPRTQADACYTQGYAPGPARAPTRWADWLYRIVVFGAMAACGVMLGLGFR